MTTRVPVICTIVLACLGAGCATNQVTYAKVDLGTDYKSSDAVATAQKFSFNGTNIGIGTPGGNSGASVDLTTKSTAQTLAEIAVATAPSSSESNQFAVIPVQNIWHSTQINLNHIQGTRALKSVDTTLIENTVKIIDMVGSIAGAAGVTFGFTFTNPPVVDTTTATAGAKQALALPILLEDVSRAGASFQNRSGDAKAKPKWNKFGENQYWYWTLVWKSERQAGGSVQICAVFGKNIEGCENATAGAIDAGAVSYLPVHACREATFYIAWTDDGKEPDAGLFVGALDSNSSFKSAHIASFPLTLADPNFVELVSLPDKGSITLNPTCGADVTSNSSDTASSRAVNDMNEVFSQMKSLRKSSNSSKTSSQSSTSTSH